MEEKGGKKKESEKRWRYIYMIENEALIKSINLTTCRETFGNQQNLRFVDIRLIWFWS